MDADCIDFESLNAGIFASKSARASCAPAKNTGNVADTLAIAGTVAISSSIIALSALSFLGLGVQPPDYDWGGLLTEGVKAFYLNPASALGPVAAIALASLTFGLFGEALARAFNPVLWARGFEDSIAPGTGAEVRAIVSNGRTPVPFAVLDVDI